MGLPLDQEKLIAGLEELEKRLRQSKASSDAALDRAPPSSLAPPTQDHAELRLGEDQSFSADERATYYPDYELEERANSRRLLLAISGLVLVIFVGALGVTLAYWTAPSSEPLAADVRPSPKEAAPVAAPPASAQTAPGDDANSLAARAAQPAVATPAPPPAAQPAPSAEAAPPAPSTGAANVPAQQAAPVEQAAPPPEVRTVTILPDGSLAPASAGQETALPPPVPAGGPSSPVAGQAEQPASAAVKPDTTGQTALAAKAAKKRAAARAAKKSAAKAELAPPADLTPHPAPPAANDGILQGAQRAFGSVTGAVRQLVGGE